MMAAPTTQRHPAPLTNTRAGVPLPSQTFQPPRSPLLIATLLFSTALLTVAAGVYAGAQSALAGGGSLITFPALLLAGSNSLGVNMTSTIALFPSQVISSIVGRKLAGGVDTGRHHPSLRQFIVISLVGGVLNVLLLLATPPSFFARLVPYLVLLTTSVFARDSFRHKPLHAASGMSTTVLATTQSATAVYGGYFGSGIGFLMLTALTVIGRQVCMAGATKNALAMTMSASTVTVFAFSLQVSWAAVVALGIGGIAGGFVDAWLLHRLPEKVLRGFVVTVGIILTVWLFMRAWMQRPLAA